MTWSTDHLEQTVNFDLYLSVFLHDLDHLLGGVGRAVGEEGDEEGDVVHRLEVRPDVLDPAGQLGAVAHVVLEGVGVARHAVLAAHRVLELRQ